MMTYNRWNRRGGFKQLFYSCAIDGTTQLVYEATRRLHNIIQYVAGLTDSLFKISDLTHEINFHFRDQAAWAGTEPFVTYCGEKNPASLLSQYQDSNDTMNEPTSLDNQPST
jgi:hypothetical protein